MNDNNIDTLINEISADFCQDQNKKSASSNEKRGRTNKGMAKENREIYKEDRKRFNAIKQPLNFNNEIIERVGAEVVENENIEEFKELYKLTCYTCLDDFVRDNEELAKKSSFLWYKRVLIKIKENTPKIYASDLEKCIAVWDILSEFMEYIGLYITFETFQKVTSIYKYQLEEMTKLNPKYVDFVKKINIERDSALLNELQYNPYNQTNKMFIAKVHGIVEQTAPKQIEVTHNIQNFDNISAYRLKDRKNDE
jgi:hypothetical protein